MNLMKRLDVNGVLYLMASAALLLSIIAAIRSLIALSPRHLERTFDVLTPQATPLAHDSVNPP